MKRAWLLAFAFGLVCLVARAETGIQDVVRLVESRYGVHHRGVPGLWLAKPFMIGSKVGKLKVAEFETVRIPVEDSASFGEELNRTLGPEWSRVVEVWSKRDGEWTVVYMRASGERLQMLVVSSERHDGVNVVQMSLSDKAGREWMGENLVKGKKTRHPQAMSFSSQP